MKTNVNLITDNFPISGDEYFELEEKLGKLIWHASHELKRKNTKNNFTDDVEDIRQELQMSMLRAGSYFKRQIYIEKCLNVVKEHAQDSFMKNIVNELEDLWKNRTKHGANRQKYGPFQEELLDKIVKHIVPKNERPDKNSCLKIDSKFLTYCKAICWNAQKQLGKKISKEKVIRNGSVSLSEFDFIGSKTI